ncbi:MAG: hypothetical protein Q9188_005192 [Gyalolechia gomerana]
MAEKFNDVEDPRHRNKCVGTVELQGPNGQTRAVNLEGLTKADAELAAKFGYKPVFKRQFGYLSTFSFAVTTSFSYPLYAGGASSVVWAWLISGAGCMATACSVAELVSAYPTCGGLITGWLNMLGQITGVASSEYGAAQLLLAAISMGSDFTYLPTTGTVIGVMAASSVLTGLVNSLSTYSMEKMTKTYGLFHIRMTDYDATAHITEEISNAEKKAPWAISMAMLFTWLGGFVYNIVLCFVMGDMASILESPAQPVVQIFYNVLGKGGGVFYTVCAFFIIKFVTFTAMYSG